jgi:Fusaric acid resistance protein family
MTGAEPSAAQPSPVARWVDYVAGVLQASGPPLLFGLRLWASVCLALYIAFWLELENAYWAGTSAAIMCQPHLGASLCKGWYRMIGTVVGAVAIVVLTACFPQDRAPFLSGWRYGRRLRSRRHASKKLCRLHGNGQRQRLCVIHPN